MKKTVQFFTKEYLEQCKTMKPEQIVKFLDDFRKMVAHSEQSRAKSRLISIKMPEDLLEAFKRRAQSEGVPYQRQIKKLMREWVVGQ